MNMTASAPEVSPGQLLREVEAHTTARLNEIIDRWSRATTELTHWEVSHLAAAPRAEDLATHRMVVEALLRMGDCFQRVLEMPEYDDAARRAEVLATLGCLRDKLALWHQSLPAPAEATRLLETIFPA
jgi:hypothetical protein